MKRKIEYIATSKLLPYANNSNTHSDWQIKKIADSIKQFGFTNPVLVAGDMTILAGHGRCLAAMQIDMDEVPCIVLKDMTTNDARAYVIADNQLAKLSEWDHKILASELIELNQFDYNLDVIGFDDKELDKLRGLVPDAGWPDQENKGNTDDDEIPEVEQNIHGVKLGDIYQLGDHRLMCGDSTDKDSVSKLMDGEKADMVFTDPPYGMEFQSNFKKNKFKPIENDDKFLDIAPIIWSFLNEDSAAYICTRWDVYPIWLKQFNKFNIKNCIVWIKGGGGLGDLKNSYSPNHEFIIVAHKGNAPLIGKRDKDSWEIGRDDVNSYDHPTQKPVALSQFAIEHHAKKTVVDLFLGSGSTLIACEKTNRKCYGMELDPHYCSVIIERWQNFTGNKSELIDRTHSDLCQSAGLSDQQGDAICVDGCPDNEPITQPSGCL